MFRTAHMIPMIFLAASAPEISAWGWNSDAFSILDEASIKYVCKNCRPISLANRKRFTENLGICWHE